MALLDVVERSSIGQDVTTTSSSAGAETDGVCPRDTAWNRGWSCGLASTSDSKQCHTSKTSLPKRNVTNVEFRLVLAVDAQNHDLQLTAGGK